MKTIQLENIESFIVVSDIHLRDAKDSLTQLFVQKMREIKDVDAIFLLGDIFDFIAGPIPFFLDYWKDVFDAFKYLKAKNIQVYFIEGNHDFGFEHFTHACFTEAFTACGDFCIKLVHSKYGNIILKHGDDVVCKNSYHPFRKIVKSKWLQKLAVILFSGSWMHAIFSRYARVSRKHDKYRPLPVAFMYKKIQNFIGRYYSDCDVFIMGHVHKEVEHLLHVTKPVKLLIGQAWFDKPSILKVSKKEICRYSNLQINIPF